jgi:hypothetical protein
MAIIKADKVLDNWATIIENGAGNGNELLEVMGKSLEEIKLPNVRWSMNQVYIGLMGGQSREFMLVTHGGLREYTMYIYARDVGKHLDCGWFMTVSPGFFKKTFSKHLTGNPVALSQNLDVFAQQDLTAWTSIVHRTFLNHVKELMEKLEQDVTRMSTTSKGFLSVW